MAFPTETMQYTSGHPRAIDKRFFTMLLVGRRPPCLVMMPSLAVREHCPSQYLMFKRWMFISEFSA
jgi:hypothetical protein